MKRLILTLAFIVSIAISCLAQMPNGFKGNYSLAGSFDSNGNERYTSGAPSCSVLVMTMNFGFGPSSSAILTLDFGWAGSSTLTFDGYAGMQNGWHVYVSDMGIAGKNYLLISRDGSTLRYVNNFGGGDIDEYNRK